MIRLDRVASPSFTGHESFPFRHSWLKKGYDGLQKDTLFLSRPEALVVLGVGKNMVYSIRHWMEVLGLAEPIADGGRGKTRPLQPTSLAHSLLADHGWDPYLEDDGTLWLLHTQLVTSCERATTWWWVFNRPSTSTLSRSGLLAELVAAAEASGWRAAESSLKRDIDCFVRTYLPVGSTRSSQEDALSCPLCALGLLQPTKDKSEFLLSFGWQPSLPDDIFRWGLAKYLQRTLHTSGQQSGTVSLDRLLYDEASPGRVFRLREDAIVDRLSALSAATDGGWVYDETVGLRQLLVNRTYPPSVWLERYYDHDSQHLRVIEGGAA